MQAYATAVRLDEWGHLGQTALMHHVETFLCIDSNGLGCPARTRGGWS